MNIGLLNRQYSSPPSRQQKASVPVQPSERLDRLEAAAPQDDGNTLGKSLKAFALLGLAVGVSACQPESGAQILETQDAVQTDVSVNDLRADSPTPGTVINPDGSSSSIIGNTKINSDGSSSTRIGDTVLNSDGSSSTRIGDTVLNSDGSSSTRIGDTVINSDGSSSTRVGNTIINSNGTTSTRIGNTIINSDGSVSFDHGLGVNHNLWK